MILATARICSFYYLILISIKTCRIDAAFLSTPSTSSAAYNTRSSFESIDATKLMQHGRHKKESDDKEVAGGKPIGLDSLQNPSFLGLEKERDFDALDTGVPLFTGSLILVGSIYLMLTIFFGDML